MRDFLVFLSYLAVCSGVTYLIRMVPLVFFRKKIKSRFLRSFLYYVPYAVLTVMTFPAIFYSTDYFASALLGTLVSVALALFNRSLIVVAVGASFAVLCTEAVIKFLL